MRASKAEQNEFIVGAALAAIFAAKAAPTKAEYSGHLSLYL